MQSKKERRVSLIESWGSPALRRALLEVVSQFTALVSYQLGTMSVMVLPDGLLKSVRPAKAGINQWVRVPPG